MHRTRNSVAADSASYGQCCTVLFCLRISFRPSSPSRLVSCSAAELGSKMVARRSVFVRRRSPRVSWTGRGWSCAQERTRSEISRTPKSTLKVLLTALTVALVPRLRRARFALVELSETSNDPYNRTAACMRTRLGERVCQRTSGRHSCNTRRGQRHVNGRRAAWWSGASADS